MGANAQTVVPVFTAGQVLTAAQVTQINTGIPVFATTTTRDAAFGGTGEKTLAQGQYAYIENTGQLLVYTGSAWQLASAGTLVKSQTVATGVSSVAVTGVFSSSYDNYLITYTGGLGSSTNADLNIQLGSTTTGYYNYLIYGQFGASTLAAQHTNNTPSMYNAGISSTTNAFLRVFMQCPNLAVPTIMHSAATQINGTNNGFTMQGTSYINNTTQYTDFTILVASGTITGGTVRVYGLAN